MRITSKGQVTIPIEIRERLGLLPNCEVEFEVEGNAVRIRKARGRRARGRGRSIVERLRGRATAGMSTDEIMALTRG
jgi:AbrB family looped-hinge helix DNA binding protein